MKRVLTVLKRFFIRLWFLNRNQTIVKAHKLLGKALAERAVVLESVPQNYRQDIVDTDPVLKEAREMAYKLHAFFQQVGVSYEK